MITIKTMARMATPVVFFLGMSLSANALAVPLIASWSISGPGTTSAVQNAANDWTLSYSLNPAGFNTVEWDVTSAPVAAAGDYHFDWNYSGFHAFFQVTAFLIASDGTVLYSAGPANCCTSPSSGFNQSGFFSFTGVSAGDIIGFTMGGSNFDSNNQLRGALNLRQVPEPATLALLGLGFVALGFARRHSP